MIQHENGPARLSCIFSRFCSPCCGILNFRRNFESRNSRRSVIFELFIYHWDTFSEADINDRVKS